MTNWLNQESEPLAFPMCDFERLKYEIRPGDVLLVEGRSRVSEVIKMITQSRWSHSALYIGRLHDIENDELRETVKNHYDGPANSQLLIEGILGQGTIVTPLDSYQKDNLRVCRPAAISRKDCQQVIAFAIRNLGTPYNVRQLVDLARFLLPWGFIPRRWRSTLFTHHPGVATETVCSTMLADGFGSVNYPVLPVFKRKKKRLEWVKRNTKLYTPADFDYSPFFDVIKFPFMGEFDKAPYRDLPWNREGLIANADGEYVDLSLMNENGGKSAPDKTN